MKSHGSYHLDLFIAAAFRLCFLLSLLAIVALMSACGTDSTGNPRSFSLNGRVSADTRPISASGDTSVTRSPLPQRGVDEKSDSSLSQPSR